MAQPNSPARQIGFWVIIVGIPGIFVWLLRDVLPPFLAGMAIAYLLDPVVDRLAVRMPRWAATLVALLIALLVLLALIVAIVPIVLAQLQELLGALPGYVEQVRGRFEPLIVRLRELAPSDGLQSISGQVGDTAAKILDVMLAVAAQAWRSGAALFSIVSLAVLTPVIAFYLLRDWDKLVDALHGVLPLQHRATVLLVLRRIDETLSNFIRGQAIVCLILGVLYAVALTIAGLRFGILVGLISGALSFVPLVGSFIGLLLSVGLALAQFDDWTRWLIIALIFLAGQALEGNFLTPKLIGDSVGLHPVWVMFALFAGGSLAGITGVLLAVPVAAVIGVVIRFAVERYRTSAYFLGRDPVPERDGGADPPAAARDPVGRSGDGAR